MRIPLILFFLFISGFANGQEYWDREDFEIGNRGIENTWREFSFTWQSQSSFNLPDGSFLNLRNDIQKKQVDMLAVITKDHKNRIERKVDLGSPLPEREKEKKVFQVTGEARLQDRNDLFSDPFNSNPFYRNSPYNNRGFGVRRYYNTPYQYYY